MNTKNTLAHTKWNCKYHIVFAPKYRRKEIYGEKKAEIGKILRELCKWKEVEIIEANACPDHTICLCQFRRRSVYRTLWDSSKGRAA